MRRRTLYRTTRLALLALAGLTLWHRPAAAGPWTKDLGELYLKLGQGFFFANSFRDAAGKLNEGTEYLGATTSVYFEVGLLRGLHVWGYLPYVVAQNSNQEDGSNWLRTSGGDALAGLQFTPPIGLPFPAALKLEFKIPLYDVSGVTGPYASRFPAPGDGQLDVAFWLSAGGSLSTIPLFFYGELGYRHRTEHYVGAGSGAAFGDGVVFFASVGYTIRDWIIVALNTGGVVPFEEDGATKGYVTFGPSVYVPIFRGLAAEASFDPMVYTNKNASPGLGFSLGLSYKR